MKFCIVLLSLVYGVINMSVAAEKYNQNGEMLVRISEIEIYPQYLDEYLQFAQSVAEKSVALEKGVIAIYPMMQIKNPFAIRILEIYQNQEAYQKHIASQHFQTYKKGTLHMVKSLDLVDMYQLSPQNFTRIFKKS